MKKITTICILLCLFMVGGITMDAQNNTSRKKTKSKTGVQRKSSVQKTSNASDLGLFGVHGDVKSIKYTEGFQEIFLYPYEGTFNFSKGGECLNFKSYIKKIDGNWDKAVLKRNKNGQLIEIVLEVDGLSGTYEDFLWNDDVPTGYSINLSYNHGDVSVNYKDGRINTLLVKDSFDGEIYDLKFTYYDFKEDSRGNWISCKVKIEGEVTYNGDPPSKYYENKQIKRDITYY